MMIRVAGSPPGLLLLSMVSNTSTRVLGVTNPATPETSLTRMVSARLPFSIMTGSPPPAPRGASLPSRIGSFSWSPPITPRPTTSAGLETNPVGSALPLHSIVLTSPSASTVPGAIVRGAT